MKSPERTRVPDSTEFDHTIFSVYSIVRPCPSSSLCRSQFTTTTKREFHFSIAYKFLKPHKHQQFFSQFCASPVVLLRTC